MLYKLGSVDHSLRICSTELYNERTILWSHTVGVQSMLQRSCENRPSRQKEGIRFIVVKHSIHPRENKGM
jgi:hypothetical protein